MLLTVVDDTKTKTVVMLLTVVDDTKTKTVVMLLTVVFSGSSGFLHQ
jgi:hypothetical protein